MKLDDIKLLVGMVFGRKKVRTGDRLIEDLGAESLDIVTLMAAVEDRFGVVISEEDIDVIRTVDDLYRYVFERI